MCQLNSYFMQKIVFIMLLLISVISLAEETSVLDKISVVDNKHDDTNLKPEDSSTSTLDTSISEIELNIEELKGVAGTQGDPLGAVKLLPGIVSATSSSSGSSAGFYVRGSNTNENIFWVDGLPIGYIYHLGGRFSVLNPDTISSFKTYLGGFGVGYGDRLGGVVSVNTRKPLRDKLQQSYQLGFYDASFKIEGPVSENSAGYFTFRKSYFDLLLPSVGNISDSENTYTQFPQFWDLQAKYHYELQKGQLYFAIFAADDRLKVHIKDEKDVVPDPELAGDLGGSSAFQTYGIKWQQSLNTQLEQTIRVGLLSQESVFSFGTQLGANDPNRGDSFGVKSLSDSYFILPFWQLGSENSQWKVGIDFYAFNFDVSGYISQPCREGQANCTLTTQPKFTLDQEQTGQSIAQYIQLTQEITPKFFATLGLRNSNARFGNFNVAQVSPRLNLEYDLAEKAILTASWGKFVQLPQGHEIIDDIGNSTLVMTQAEHRIVGIKFELSNLWSTQVEAFQKPMTKLVVSRDMPENYANEGKGLAEGFDVLLKRKWHDRSFGWISYSYLKTSREDKGQNTTRLFSGDQPHTLKIVYNQPFTGSWQNWVWGTNLRLNSGLPYTEVTGRESKPVPGSSVSQASCQANPGQNGCYWSAVYGGVNKKRLPLYASLDLSMERKWHYTNADITARFELLNVTGLFRPNVVGYQYEQDYADYKNPKKTTDFPFFPSFSIRANF